MRRFIPRRSVTCAVDLDNVEASDSGFMTESTLMESIYVFWADQNRIWQMEIDEGFSVDDLLIELGSLKQKRSAINCMRDEGLTTHRGRTLFLST
jgi:hypothetical protein